MQVWLFVSGEDARVVDGAEEYVCIVRVLGLGVCMARGCVVPKEIWCAHVSQLGCVFCFCKEGELGPCTLQLCVHRAAMQSLEYDTYLDIVFDDVISMASMEHFEVDWYTYAALSRSMIGIYFAGIRIYCKDFLFLCFLNLLRT